jgi:hypothetical protein
MMEMITMRRALLAATAILLSAGIASAAPGTKHHGPGKGWSNGPNHEYGYDRVSPPERAAIAQARAHLAFVKARAWRDGHVTAYERFQIRNAEARLQRLIFRSRYS